MCQFCRTWKLIRGELMAWRSGLATPPSDEALCSPRRFGEDARNGPECALPALWRHILGSVPGTGNAGRLRPFLSEAGFIASVPLGCPPFPFTSFSPPGQPPFGGDGPQMNVGHCRQRLTASRVPLVLRPAPGLARSVTGSRASASLDSQGLPCASVRPCGPRKRTCRGSGADRD